MLPLALVVLALLVPAQAANASALAVQQDCADSDTFEDNHSRADLQAALQEIQADLAEYGTCRQMILAELAALGKAKSSGKGGGPGPTADLDGDGVVSPEEKAVAAKKAKRKNKSESKQIAAVDDDLVQDDTAAASSDGGSGGGSLPLIVALLALICAGVGGGLWYASKRNPGLANALRRVSPSSRNS